MAEINGQLVSSTLAGITDNRNVTVEHDLFSWVDIPFFSQAQVSPGSAVLQRTPPVYAHHRQINGQRLGAYLDDYYYRIHIIPTVVKLGNISSSQGFSVIVWNAYMTPQTVTAVTGQQNGVEVKPPSALPYSIPGLLESNWGITVDNNGEPVIDEWLDWIFDNTAAPPVHITGSRVLMWPFVPDWSQSIQERLEWATDIMTSSSGAEQRRALRISPKRSFTARFLTHQNERTHFDLVIAGSGSSEWSLPLWTEMQLLSTDTPAGTTEIICDTADREFRPGMMLIIRGGDVADVFSIETAAIDLVLPDRLKLQRPLQNTWPAGARLYPAVSGRIMQQPSVERVTDQTMTTSITFELIERSDWSASLPGAQYQGFSVFEMRPDETDNLSGQYSRLLQTIKNIPGFDYVKDTAQAGFMVQGHAWFLYGAQELSHFKQLLYALRGRQACVWVSTFADDLKLTRTSNNDVLFVEKVGLSRFGFGKPGRRDIRIERADGSATYHRITAVTELDAGTERLEIEPILSDVLTTQNVGRISFLALCRLDTDAVNIEHDFDVSGVARARLAWRTLRDELER